jgi:hypothetical protein
VKIRQKCDQTSLELAKHTQRDFEADMEAADEGGSDKPDGDEGDCDSDSDYEDAEEVDWGREWSGLNLKDSSRRGSCYSMPYYMACIQSIMRATPEVVRQVQEATIQFMMKVCPAIEMASNWKDQLMKKDTLKVRFLWGEIMVMAVYLHVCYRMPAHMPSLNQELRTDAAVWCEVLAAIEVSKADEVLSISFDESDKNNNSILNVITTIRTGNEIKRLTLNGITLMAKKTSEATSEKILETFEHAQSWQQEIHDAYDKALHDYVDKGKIYPGMTKQDYEEEDYTDEKNSADAQIGNPAMTSMTRNKSSCTDHCGPAKSSNKKAKAAAKSIPALIKMYGEEWDSFSESEKKELMRLHLYGCQHHLRNIGYSNGMKAVAEHIRPLIADDVEEAKACGVQCVTGEIGMGMRSILKFF